MRWLLIVFPLLLIALVFGYVVPKLERDRYDFALNGGSGTVRLSDFDGRAVAVYFGYTHCPDICPMSLSVLAEARALLSPKDAQKVQVIFVSVDPDRDTPEALQTYAQYFDPTFIGLTAPKAVIDTTIAQYEGTHYAMLEQNKTAMGYTVGHTSFVYFFDTAGRLSSRLNHSIDPEETMHHLQKALGHAGS